MTHMDWFMAFIVGMSIMSLLGVWEAYRHTYKR
jgi:hypothetical protein